MTITLRGEKTFVPVSTVTVAHDGGQTHPFHCPSCGNTINIIGGTVTQIVPYLEPSDQIVVLSTCRSCKEKYTFQDGAEQKDKTVHIVLKRQPQMQFFYCSLGGGATKDVNKILEYTKDRIYSYVHHGLVHLPYTTSCVNPTCSTLYQFS